jgi:hypothetical protein
VARSEPEAGRRIQRLAALGPFFAVDVHDPDEPPGEGWSPLSTIADDGVARRRVAGARLALAAGRPIDAVEVRVAASAVHLGLTARLLSPLLALAATEDGDAVPTLDRLRWREESGGAFPLSLPWTLLEARLEARAVADGASPDRRRWAAQVVDGPVAELSRALAALSPSEHVRRGNIASAVHGAVTVIASVGRRSTTWRTPAARARELGSLLLAHPQMQAAATGEPGTGGFRRRNCCLIYRASPPGRSGHGSVRRSICPDCVLAAR